MKWAQAGEILRASFLELDVVANDPDDVRLLLDNICEIAGISHDGVFNIVLEKSSGGNASVWCSEEPNDPVTG